MMSLCSLAVYPPMRSLKFSKLPERGVIATHNPLSLTNRKPQTVVAPLIKSDRGFMTPKISSTVNFSNHQLPDLLSKSSRLFGDGQTNSNLSVTSTAGYTQESRTTTSRILATNRSFLGSHPMTLLNVSPTKIPQVFISFRGDQLRYNFVSHLVNAFERHEIKFFIDKDEQRGKDLEHLFVRIKESKIGLPIFSTRYPESKWCMNELVKMIKHAADGKLTLIPIFYKVEPSDVRDPKSKNEFGRNFWRLVEESDQNDPIEEWRKALGGITNKMGLCLRDKSSEADFIEKIVKEVQRVMQAIKDEEE